MSGRGEESGSVREALHNAVEEVASQPQETSLEQTAPEVVNAPDDWAPEDKGAFDKISDLETRKWLLARDTGYSTKLKEFEPVQQRLGAFEKVLEPHAERLKATGQEPAAVFDNLLKAQLVLEQKPIEGIQWLIKQYGIDTKQLIEALGGNGAPPADGENSELDDLGFTPAQLKFLNERMAPADKVIEQTQAQQEAERKRVVDSTNQQTKEFREEVDPTSKQPLRPFLADQDVAKRMAILIKEGTVPIVNGDVKSALKEAYDQACRAAPSVRDKYLEAIKPPDTTSAERLKRAKRAGASLTGQGTGSQPSRQPTGSVREQLAAQMRERGLIE